MKELYTSPELKVAYFAPAEALANGGFSLGVISLETDISFEITL